MAEKFTRWSDKSTGINPFLVDSIRSPNNLIDKIFYYGKLIFIGSQRLLLSSTLLLLFIAISYRILELVIFVLSILYLLTTVSNKGTIGWQSILPMALGALLILTPPFHFVKKFCQKVLIKLSAYLVGVDFDVSFANTFRVVGIRSDASSNLSPFSTAAPGDIILSNLSNVLEIFLYEAYCSPLFVFPLYDSSQSSLCVGLPFLSAISYTLKLGNEPVTPAAAESLGVLIQKAKDSNRRIVLFIEGTKTNGSGVLEFPAQIFSQLTSPPNIHLSGVTYSSSTSSRDLTATAPTCPIGSHFERYLWLSSQLVLPQVGGITYLSSEFIPKYDSKRGMNELLMKKWIEEIRVIFTKVVNKKPLKLSLQDFESFAKYYNALKAGNMEVAKSIADARGK